MLSTSIKKHEKMVSSGFLYNRQVHNHSPSLFTQTPPQKHQKHQKPKRLFTRDDFPHPHPPTPTIPTESIQRPSENYNSSRDDLILTQKKNTFNENKFLEFHAPLQLTTHASYSFFAYFPSSLVPHSTLIPTRFVQIRLKNLCFP